MTEDLLKGGRGIHGLMVVCAWMVVLRYTAPEIIQGAGYDEKVDLWSVGVIAFILLGGYQPFDEDEERVSRDTRPFPRFPSIRFVSLSVHT